jgi:hypothetical protein
MGEDQTHNTGSLAVVKSVFRSTATAIQTFPFTNKAGDATTGITLDDFKFDGVTNGVWDGSESYLGASKTIDTS